MARIINYAQEFCASLYPGSMRKRAAAKRPARRPAAKPRAPRPKATRVSTRQPATRVSGATTNAIGRSLGAALGSVLGGPAGGSIGSMLGSGAQDLFRKITGFGDYKIQSNSLVAGPPSIAADSLPKFVSTGRAMRMTHREFIQDIVSSSVAGAFAVVKFTLQPALAFPWLSNVAANFQEYCIHGMILEFKSTSSDSLNSTNTALGTVVMATQYNVLAPDFTNKQQMEQTEFCTTGKPSQSIIHPIECARGESPISCLFTRSAPPPTSSSDLRLYDFANTYIATVGVQGTSVNLGELWISYDISLLKPQLGSAADVADSYTLGTGITTAAYFGTTPVKSASSDLGTTLTATTITVPTWVTGVIYITYIVYGTAAACTAPTMTPSAGASVYNFAIAAGVPYSNNLVGPGGASLSLNQTNAAFNVVGGGVITFSGGGLPTAATQGQLLITTLPSSLRASLT